MLRDTRFDENQIVECDLQGRVARPRSPQHLLDESAETDDVLAANDTVPAAC